jgi:hypothetical protein
MASVKSGSWFLELILNILLLAGVSFVTFASRGEQERGLAVPLFAAVSPATTRPASEAPTPAAKTPALAPLPAANLPAGAVPDAKAVGQAVTQTTAQGTQSFQQAWGTLQIWAAGLDGKITGDELKKIQDSVGQGWSGTQSVRDYLKTVNDKINAGQADQLVQEALRTLSQQANDKKLEVMNSVGAFMKSNGITWEQTQKVMGQWVSQILKMSPTDVWNSLKF